MKIHKKLHKTVVFVTHDIGEAVRLADKLIIINKGSIVANGDPMAIAGQAEAVARSFLGDSYALELLEKHQLRDYPGLFAGQGEAFDSPSSTVLTDEATFKEVLSRHADVRFRQHPGGSGPRIL